MIEVFTNLRIFFHLVAEENMNFGDNTYAVQGVGLKKPEYRKITW